MMHLYIPTDWLARNTYMSLFIINFLLLMTARGLAHLSSALLSASTAKGNKTFGFWNRITGSLICFAMCVYGIAAFIGITTAATGAHTNFALVTLYFAALPAFTLLFYKNCHVLINTIRTTNKDTATSR